jgi:hypothetical protein
MTATPEATAWRLEENADDEAGAICAGADRVRDRHSGRTQRQMVVGGERGQREDAHEALADLEPLQSWGELAGTAPPKVVQQVVAVRRDPQLAQPAEQHCDGRIDRHRAVAPGARLREQVVTRQRRLALSEARPPVQAAHVRPWIRRRSRRTSMDATRNGRAHVRSRVAPTHLMCSSM